MTFGQREIREALDYGTKAGRAPLLFQEARDPAIWGAIGNTQYGLEILRDIEAEAEGFLGAPINSLPYSLFKLFQETGSRREYERESFARRNRLSYLAVLSLARGSRRYVEALEDVIWAICDEYTWCLPAHLGNTCPNGSQDPDDQARALDLFSTGTAFSLAEIVSLLTGPGQTVLAQPVAARARREIFRRVLEPYVRLSQPLWWENAEMNWAAVCAGSIGAAAMYLMEDAGQLARLLQRVLKTMGCYLRGFGAGGASAEGVSYWTYGFGFFTYFAALLKERTAGRIDLMHGEKVKQIALFPQRCSLTGNQVVCFSDCPPAYDFPPGLMAYLQREFVEARPCGLQYSVLPKDTGLARWADTIRSLVWGEPRTENDPPAETGAYFGEVQWLVSKKTFGAKQICFAAKGGHNDEPHNHNDLGSFIIHIDGDTLLVDPGRGEYTRSYFGPERYRFFPTSSRGHSVPIIDGLYQQEGPEHAAKVLESRITSSLDVLVLELAAAYGNENLRSLVRKFVFSKVDAPYLVLEDEFVFARPPQAVTERLVSLFKPVVPASGLIRLEGGNGCLQIEYPYREMHLETGREVFTTQESEARTVYIMDLIHDHIAARFAVRLKFLFHT